MCGNVQPSFGEIKPDGGGRFSAESLLPVDWVLTGQNADIRRTSGAANLVQQCNKLDPQRCEDLLDRSDGCARLVAVEHGVVRIVFVPDPLRPLLLCVG